VQAQESAVIQIKSPTEVGSTVWSITKKPLKVTSKAFFKKGVFCFLLEKF